MKRAWCLSIGGLDATSGAGVLADHRVLSQLKIPHCVLMSANTLQNTGRLERVQPVDVSWMNRQYKLLHQDIGLPKVIKVSLLPTQEHLQWLLAQTALLKHAIILIDPIIQTGKQQRLTDVFTPESSNKLWKIAHLITPNYWEMNHLFGSEKALQNAMKIHQFMTLLTDHPNSNNVVEQRLWVTHQKKHVFSNERLAGLYHGSGCKLSAYLMAGFMLDWEIMKTVGWALKQTMYDLANSKWEGVHQIIPD